MIGDVTLYQRYPLSTRDGILQPYLDTPLLSNSEVMAFEDFDFAKLVAKNQQRDCSFKLALSFH